MSKQFAAFVRQFVKAATTQREATRSAAADIGAEASAETLLALMHESTAEFVSGLGYVLAAEQDTTKRPAWEGRAQMFNLFWADVNDAGTALYGEKWTKIPGCRAQRSDAGEEKAAAAQKDPVERLFADAMRQLDWKQFVRLIRMMTKAAIEAGIKV